MAKIKILVGTTYGTSQEVAEDCAAQLTALGHEVGVLRQPQYDQVVSDEPQVLLVCSATIGQGEMFGELSVIDGEYTSAFVVTETPCRIVGLDGNILWELFRRTPYVAHNLMTTLARRLRDSNKVIEDLQRRLREQAGSGDD